MPASGSPLALTPFGVGTPATITAPPANPPTYCRYINPGSRDLEIDSDTRHFKQMPKLRQRVVLTLLTLKRSSSVLPEVGVEIPPKLDDRSEQRIRKAVYQAFYRMTTVEKVMRIDGLLISRNVGRVQITLAYTDLTTGRPGGEPVSVTL
jgi:hypothetical protein